MGQRTPSLRKPSGLSGGTPGTATTRGDLLSFAVIGSILTYVWRVQDLYPIFATIKLPVLASLAALGFYLTDKDRRRAIRTIQHPITRMVCYIMLLAVLSVPTSVHDGMSFRFIRDDLGKNFLLMIILAASVRSFADVRRYALAMLFGGIVYAFYVYVNVPIGLGGRLGDIAYYDANDLGMFLVCTLPFAIYFVVRGKDALVRIAAAAALALFLLVIVKTGSRGAFLGLIAVSLYLLFLFRSISKGLRIFAVVGGFAALMVVGSEQYWSMMSTLLNPKEDYNWSGQAEAGRMETWRRGMGYMLSRPITGVGASAFPIAEGTLSPLASRQEYGIGLKWSAAHNSFVQIGAELGVFGLLSFILLVVHGFRAARSVGPSPPAPTRRATDEEVLGHALAGSIVGYIVAGFFLSQAYAAYTFVLYGMIVGLAKVTATRQGSAIVLPAPRRARRNRVPAANA